MQIPLLVFDSHALAGEDAEYAPYKDRNIYADRIDRLGWLGKEKDHVSLHTMTPSHRMNSGRFLSVNTPPRLSS